MPEELAAIREQQGAVADEQDAADAAITAGVAAQVSALAPDVREAITAELQKPLTMLGASISEGEGDDSQAVAAALSAIADLSEDAAEAGAIPPALVVTLDSLEDPDAAALVAGQLRALGTSREFRAFCRKPAAKATPQTPAPRAAPAPPASSLDEDLKFMAGRMSGAKGRM